MREYFDAELRLLHESAQEFARAYPEQAGMLNLSEVRDRDPYVERLLEGMAFLTAQIRQHIDDDIPEISETLLSQLWPHFLRPFPSATVVEMAPRIGQLQQAQRIPRGMLLLTPPVGDDRVICRFRTTSETVLNPIRIVQVNLEEPGGGGSVIRVTVQVDSGVSPVDLELRDLRLHLHADPGLGAWLFRQLTDKLVTARVLFPETPAVKPVTLGGLQSVKPAHYSPEDSLIETSGRSFSGFHILQDYFCFRDKYMFVTVTGLENLDWPGGCQQFQLEFTTRGTCPQDHKLHKDNIRLHCVPAVNLFEQTSEPVHLTHQRSTYPVIADVGSREGVQVYSVDKVVGLETESGERHEYFPMCSFRHRTGSGRYYHAFRRTLSSGHPEAHISVGGHSKFRSEMLSCRITAINGNYPRRYLREGSINTPSAEFPSFASLRNLTRPTPMLPPPERERFQWELISHLSLNYSSLASLPVLKQVLEAYNWSNDEQNRRRIDGISSIDVKPVERVRRGALMRGLDITLVLHEENYRSIPDMYLFGLALHHFLGMYASINCFVKTRVLCHPSNEELLWDPILGSNTPI